MSDPKSSHPGLKASESTNVHFIAPQFQPNSPNNTSTAEQVLIDSHDTTELEPDIWKEEVSEPQDLKGVIAYLQHVLQENAGDLNFPRLLLNRAVEVLKPGVPQESVLEVARLVSAELKLARENSPYPEVRAIVDAVDDPSTPVSTFRMWSIGIFLVFLGTGLNQFFAPRLPSISLSITFAQLVAYPLGSLMAVVLPKRIFRFGRYHFTLNPGPFNMKEHMLISIMANASFGGAYVTDIIAVLRIKRFYNDETLGNNLGFQLIMALSSQMLGYTLAGLTRKFLVYPSEMVWWGNLLEISVLKALHSNDDNRPVNGWKISRMWFFTACMVGYGIYFILPDVFFQSMSFFNWTTWIAPENVKLALITGTISGLGLNPLPTLDWNFMSINPVVTPLWSILNVYVGALLAFVVICCMYFKNVAYTMYIPINSNGIFDRYGKHYNSSRVLHNGILDQAKYESYSPPFMSAANIVLYTAFFALYTSTLVHSLLFYGKLMGIGFSSALKDAKSLRRWRLSSQRKNYGEKYDNNNTIVSPKPQWDSHYRLMLAYPEVPHWWFLVIGAISTSMAIFMIEWYKTQMPVWGLAFAFGLALVLIIPIGIMGAVASISAPLNVLSELVGGYALAGRPLGNMLFKTFGYITAAQALGYVSDMKLAHYVKIPPRATFAAQTVGTILSALISVFVLNWQIDSFQDLCSPNQPLHFTCPTYNTFFSSSIIWGAIGPLRLFTREGALYSFCMYGFLIGAVAPFIPWLALKRWPLSKWRFVHMPVIISGFLTFAPTNLAYLTPALPLALFFQSYVKYRYTAWYGEILIRDSKTISKLCVPKSSPYDFTEKYALTLTAGIGAGVAVFGLIYFFAIQYTGNQFDWVGNQKHITGCDGRACCLKMPPKEGFGPTHWS